MPRNAKATPDGGPRTLHMPDVVDQLDPVEEEESQKPHRRPEGIDQIVNCINRVARNLPDPTHREVYRAIAYYADETGRAEPTFEQIGHEADISVRNAKRVVPNLARLGYLSIKQEAVTKGPNKGCYHNVYQFPQVATGWTAPAPLPVTEVNKPVADQVLAQQDRIIAAKDRRIAELEQMLGIEPSPDDNLAPKGSSSNNDYDDEGRVPNWHSSTSPTATAEGRVETATCSDDMRTCQASPASHAGHEEVKAWVDAEWDRHLSGSWKGD